jgi:hypothetical protein
MDAFALSNVELEVALAVELAVAGGGALAAEAIFYSSNRMKAYHAYFLFLKFLLIIQTILIFFQKANPNQISYIAADILFKTSLGLFLMIYFHFSNLPGMDYYDRLIASFAGVLLAFDAVYISLPMLLVKLGVKLPKWLVVKS